MKGKSVSLITAAMVALGASAQTPVANPEIKAYAYADLNKDRKKDFVFVTNEGNGTSAPTGVRVAYNNGKGWDSPVVWKNIPFAKAVDAGDLDSDGKEDVAFSTMDPAGNTSIVAYFAKDGFNVQKTLYSGKLPIEDIAIGDIEGDKLADVSATVNPGAHMRTDRRTDVGYKKTYFVYFKGDGKGMIAVMPERLGIDNPEAVNIDVADFDGDGLNDIMTRDIDYLEKNMESKDYDMTTAVSYIKNRGNLQFDERKKLMIIDEWLTDIQADPGLCPEKPNLSFLLRKGYWVTNNDASDKEVVCKFDEKRNGFMRETMKIGDTPVSISKEGAKKFILDIYEN